MCDTYERDKLPHKTFRSHLIDLQLFEDSP